MRLSPIRVLSALSLFALAACTTTAPRPPLVLDSPSLPSAPSPLPAQPCTTCGRVERIDTVATNGAAKPRGAVLGGVVGGVLTKPATATAGSGGGRSYRIVVLLDNGRRLILSQPQLAAGIEPGARVRVDRSRVVLLR